MKQYKTDFTGKKWLKRSQPVTAWAVLVPGTLEPISVLSSDAAKGTRQYVLFCDHDAKERAVSYAEKWYPECHRYVVPVKVTATDII